MIGGTIILEDHEIEWHLVEPGPELSQTEPIVSFTVTHYTPEVDPRGLQIIYRESATVLADDFNKAMFVAVSNNPDHIFGQELKFTNELLWEAVERVKKVTSLCWLP